MHRKTETGFLSVFLFLALPLRILETQELFTRTYFTHKTTYAYLSLFMDCWNIQDILNSDRFWAGDSRFWGGFPSFGILAPRIQTCHFAPKNCIFWGASFDLATLDPEKLQSFHGNPLNHCYTLTRVKSLLKEFFGHGSHHNARTNSILFSILEMLLTGSDCFHVISDCFDSFFWDLHAFRHWPPPEICQVE